MVVELTSYPLIERTRWCLVTGGLLAPSAQLWILFAHSRYRLTALIVICTIYLVLVVLAGFRQKNALAASPKFVATYTTFLGWLVREKHKELSGVAWVRARVAGGWQTYLIVEVGTHGYETTELLKLAYKTGKNISVAESCCEQIAQHLEIENKGYKGLA
ncbi:hypothetical protein [Formivibrio citricus]|uniref:hypothetical protein n=1 Tax=Formivibrio citricus TaxID=83765 RepID=UPI000B817315|nr:hypothetical protein [Formivibrio citricus]